jgi:hypothetical protein
MSGALGERLARLVVQPALMETIAYSDVPFRNRSKQEEKGDVLQ